MSGSWAIPSVGYVGCQIVSNTVESINVDTSAVEYWTNGSFPNDQFAQLTIVAWPTGGVGGEADVFLRSDTAGNNLYDLAATKGSYGPPFSQLNKIVAGTFSTFSSDPTDVWVVNDVLKGTVVGSTVTIFRNGTSVNTHSDSAIASGVIALKCTCGVAVSNAAVDNFISTGTIQAFSTTQQTICQQGVMRAGVR
jgi:hypothetical protein